MSVKVLSDDQRKKEDNSDDSFFYSEPRLVNHLDQSFRRRLTNLYRERIEEDSIILDLMSSWTSHLPDEVVYKRVIGHGLNKIELECNKRLDSHWVQDLNVSQKLPLEDSSIDVCLMVAAWQYLQYPEDIAAELKRIIKPNGLLMISFSNRAFWTKAPRIWREGTDIDRMKYIENVLISQAWAHPECISEVTEASSLLNILGIKGDPFFSVVSVNS